MTDWLQGLGAWHLAQVCEGNMQRFERAMRDLTTAPGVSAEERAQIAARFLAMANATESPAQDEEPTS